MKLHQKGAILVALSEADSLWDEQIINLARREYERAGFYWENTLRIALDELAAAGLITRLEEKLTSIRGKSVLTFRYRLSEFGRTRMLDTGLLPHGRAT